MSKTVNFARQSPMGSTTPAILDLVGFFFSSRLAYYRWFLYFHLWTVCNTLDNIHRYKRTTDWLTLLLCHSWDTETFISSYINIPIFIVLYFGYKFTQHSKIIPLDQIPVRHFLDMAQKEEEEKEDFSAQHRNKWSWLTILWS